MLNNAPHPPHSPDPASANIVMFSGKVRDLIAEALQARALHPAAIVGVLNYHGSALASTYQAAFIAPAAPPLIIPPPPGFRSKP
jgi:hypothetical protein